jgi:hypothetical protein
MLNGCTNAIMDNGGLYHGVKQVKKEDPYNIKGDTASYFLKGEQPMTYAPSTNHISKPNKKDNKLHEYNLKYEIDDFHS